MDENGQILEDVELEIKNINTNKVTTVKIESGTYVSSLTLDKDDDVLITIKKEGFAFNSTYVSASDTSFRSPKDLNIELESLEDGKSFTLSNIYFETNSYQINSIIKEVLIEFSNYLDCVLYVKENKKIK